MWCAVAVAVLISAVRTKMAASNMFRVTVGGLVTRVVLLLTLAVYSSYGKSLVNVSGSGSDIEMRTKVPSV